MAARHACAFVMVIISLTAPAAVLAAPPTNDAPPGLTIEAIPFIQTIDTTDAQIAALEPSPTCTSGVTNSVWYNYTPSADVDLVADTFGSDYDTVLDVFTGTVNADFSEAALLSVGCNNDIGAVTDSQLAFSASAGGRYLIRVSARDGSGGFLTFNLNPALGNSAMAQPAALRPLLTLLGLVLISLALGTFIRRSRKVMDA